MFNLTTKLIVKFVFFIVILITSKWTDTNYYSHGSGLVPSFLPFFNLKRIAIKFTFYAIEKINSSHNIISFLIQFISLLLYHAHPKKTTTYAWYDLKIGIKENHILIDKHKPKNGWHFIRLDVWGEKKKSKKFIEYISSDY